MEKMGFPLDGTDQIYEMIELPDGLPFRIYTHSLELCRLHMHAELEILLVLRGNVRVSITGEDILLGEGDLLVIGPNVIHATEQLERANSLMVLQINWHELPGLEPSPETLLFNCRGCADPKQRNLRSLICQLYLDMYFRRKGYRAIAIGRVMQVIGLLTRDFSTPRGDGTHVARAKDSERMMRILEYVDAHLTQRITLKDIAAREYLSVNHLSAFIHRTLGMSFVEYLNSARLKCYVARLQTDADTTLEDIAAQCGFSSSQYAASLFRKTHAMSPGQYRRGVQRTMNARERAQRMDENNGYTSQYRAPDLTLVRGYILSEGGGAQRQPEMRIFRRVETDVTAPPVAAYARSALRVAAIGRAYEGLLASVQKQLRMLKGVLGFTHLHFHGIFSDEMMVVSADRMGEIRYSWRMTDQLIDFLLEIDVRPCLEFTFMPTLLASGDTTVFAYRANITAPADMGAWSALVQAFVEHCVKRYGHDEVARWIFETWNDPDVTERTWTGGENEFFRMNAVTVRAVRAALPEAVVAGPSATYIGIRKGQFLPAFRRFCEAENVRFDMLSIHVYSDMPYLNKRFAQADDEGVRREEAGRWTHLLDENGALFTMSQTYLNEIIDMARAQAAWKPEQPMLVSEWNLSVVIFNPIHDSAFAATSFLKSALEADAPQLSLTHWTLLDAMSETPLPPGEFHGGFGVLTTGGVRKPIFFAMWALNQLGRDVLYRDERCIVTREGEKLCVLAFHHPKTEKAYDLSLLEDMDTERLLKGSELRFDLRLGKLTGAYHVSRCLFDAESCAPRAVMARCGMVEPLSPEELAYLQRIADVRYSIDTLKPFTDEGGNAVGELRFTLAPCSFELVELTPLRAGGEETR